MKRIRRIFMILVMSMICVVGYAQSTISGTVKDAAGEPMIGVTVLADGTTGAVTDIDGNFTINNVSSSAKLKISYIGYVTQEIPVGKKTTFNIVLNEDKSELDEVVVVGYGTMKKSDLTGSVSSVGTDAITQKGAANVMESLQGSVPGVNITQTSGRAGGDFNIEIRGKSSTNSDTKPIYVVDGVICSDINFLNEQDIERIDILKDASSTAIYGSRATAGVVIVTTKSGATIKRGEEKASISYDGYYGITKPVRMPDFQSARQFRDYRFLKFLTYAEGVTTAQSGRPGYMMGSSFEQMAIWNGTESVMKRALENGDIYDWPSLVTQNGHQQNHYISVSGNTAKTSYHMGLGYNSIEGIYTGDKSNRINFKGSLDADINKYISAGFSVNLARIENDYANDAAIKEAYRMNPFMKPYDEDGNLYDMPGQTSALGTESTGHNFSSQPNPLLRIKNQERNRETWRALGNVYLTIKPFTGITFKTMFAPNFTYYREGQFDGTLIDNDQNAAKKNTQRALTWTWDNILTYDKTFAEKHSVNLMGLFSLTDSNTEADKLAYTGVLDGTTWWNLNSGTYDATNSSNSYSENSMMSYALRANYSYAGKYMITGTVRWDGSSKFAKDNRWGCFPSAAIAWRMSEENWMKNIDWLSNLKLRLSYGVTGNNAGIGNYATQQTVQGPAYYPFGSTYKYAFYPSSIVNKELSWETSKEVNFGIDFGFFNNRLTGTVDIYEKNSEDLLFNVKLPLEAGASSKSEALEMTTNIGKVRNRGIEFSLTGVILETKDWHWDATVTYSKNKNEVREINGTGSDLPNDNLFIGHPVNNVYGYDWTGIVTDRDMIVPDTKIAVMKGLVPGSTMKEYDYYYTCYGWTEGNAIIDDVDGDGKFTDADKKIWSSDPSWTGSLTTNLSYKNWDLSASLYTKQNYTVASEFYGQYLDFSDRGRGRLGVDYYIPAGTLLDCDGINPDGTYINPVWQTSTHYGSYPFPNNGGANGGVGPAEYQGGANKYVDASYVKVKNITLGYTFSKKLFSKIGLQRLRLYCTVTNPFVWSDYKGFDPEWANSNLKYDGPSTMTWEFGANIKF